ncbi:MAG: DNA polymerase III subunit chi [Gammaproteobacteria bacterium]|jgi:DNA polymerase-3 subunit chi|nr:DNA polymerase III subunit chi [Gammaproteobacteria bacterium]
MKVLKLYFLSRSDPDVLVPFLARLGEKALEQNLRMWIDIEDETLVRQLDAYLWTYRDGSFVPHGTDDDLWNRLVIAPLHGTLPAHYTAVTHVLPQSPRVNPPPQAVKIAEVHADEDEDSDLLQARLVAYNAAGWEVETHRIMSTPNVPKSQRI